MSGLFRILLIFTTLLSLSLSEKDVIINPNEPLQSQFDSGATTYVILHDLDLKKSNLRIPHGAVLTFKGGSLYNGTVSGRFYVKGIEKKTFNVSVLNGGKILNRMPIYNHAEDINNSVIFACSLLAELKEDINISSDILLSCSLNGRGHKILASKDVSSVLVLNGVNGLVINDLIIERNYSGLINKNYAIVCNNSSNITIKKSTIEGRIQFVNKHNTHCCGINILKCILTCDLTCCPQGWEYGQDHIAFYSIRDIRIENCKIISKNVNRIIKTSQHIVNSDYSLVNRCTDNVLFINNIICGSSTHGKQMWDMYCGTTNVTIRNNSFTLNGFSRFIEDKSYQEKLDGDLLVSSNIKILNNYVSTIGSDLFLFCANPNCDNFELSGNRFVMKGPNINEITGNKRSCGGYLQGYNTATISNNKFIWADEAIGLLLFKVNFDCKRTVIVNNWLQDTFYILVSSARSPVTKVETSMTGDRFIYKKNKKQYTSNYNKTHEEIYFSDLSLTALDIVISRNTSQNQVEIIFDKNVFIETIRYKFRTNIPGSILKKHESVQWLYFND